MTLETVLGEPALFRIDDPSELPADLTLRERRLLVGAVNFHALMAPGRTLTLHCYGGSWETLPRTTDDSTFTGMSRTFRKRLFSFGATSVVLPEVRTHIPAEAIARELAATSVRHLHISSDSVLEFDPPRDVSPDPVRRVLRAIRSKTPLLYDEARDLALLRHRGSLTTPAPRRRYDAEFRPGGIHAESEIVVAPQAPEAAPRAVIVGLHWFELGGAERWAFESVRLIREAGFLPIVLTNRDSHQPWIGRPELDGALVIPFSEPTSRSQTSGVEELLRALLSTFDVRGVVVHHNQWLYDRLHWIARSRPGVPIMDSTHIVEYRGGGFPLSSVLVEEVISAHHVISPTLARWMVEVQNVPPEKVVMAPLGGLTVQIDEPEFAERAPGAPLTVAFVGRMARQKAPEVFVNMVHRLRGVTGLRFIMHGDGELASAVGDIIASLGVQDRIERRDSHIPVTRTLEEAHLLVVPSHNEGLTLTTLEAVEHGVPVVSTDVGAQRDIIPERALVPRGAHAAVRALARLVAALAVDENARRDLWIDERDAERTLLARQTANDWFAQEVSKW
ncbi:glycosyltransferase [Microbacterium caowuchunii]|uniref:Glycosyltransferase family 4 protein n=1 Tax=Microbacterium caowuchunii TaxID=2614638 RepID=A0A5N0TPP5_9MICO|nr:glycosyltransferase [Microbacterium caowuchunii]KAA9135369.1 glycosyltransferase family 4 protein [Microbacterium caowuchunii]